MNISFNGLKHISGTPQKVLKHLNNFTTNDILTSIAVDVQPTKADVFILTDDDADKYLREHVGPYDEPLAEGSANDTYKAGIEMGKKVKPLLTNKELIMKYFYEQKANGAEVEEIKL